MKFFRLVLPLLVVFSLMLSGCNTAGISTQKDPTPRTNPTSKPLRNVENLLLLTDKGDTIILDSSSMKKDKTKEMEVDLNGDGKLEYFLISADHPNGIKIDGFIGKIGQNFSYDISIEESTDEYEDLKDGFFVQVTCYDFDKDNVKEVAVSVGNKLNLLETIIYKVHKSKVYPFKLVGRIEGQEKMIIEENGNIVAPYGSAGLFDEYKYLNNNLYSLQKEKLKLVKEIVNENSNPIDAWFAKMEKQYGNSHTDGWITYTYGNAWKAELRKLVTRHNTKIAKKYYDSVVKKAESKCNQIEKAEEKIGWTTGSSGRVQMARAEVYKNGLFQFDNNYSDFIFNADAAARNIWKGVNK